MSIINYVETHKFAPELNKVHLRDGAILETPTLDSIKNIRAFYFSPAIPGRYVKIVVSNTEHNIHKIYQGYVKSYKEISTFLKSRKEYHNLPGTSFNLSIKRIA